jgi:hypothetical protein
MEQNNPSQFKLSPRTESVLDYGKIPNAPRYPWTLLLMLVPGSLLGYVTGLIVASHFNSVDPESYLFLPIVFATFSVACLIPFSLTMWIVLKFFARSSRRRAANATFWLGFVTGVAAELVMGLVPEDDYPYVYNTALFAFVIIPSVAAIFLTRKTDFSDSVTPQPEPTSRTV